VGYHKKFIIERFQHIVSMIMLNMETTRTSVLYNSQLTVLFVCIGSNVFQIGDV
jgi:hypothetical protein